MFKKRIKKLLLVCKLQNAQEKRDGQTNFFVLISKFEKEKKKRNKENVSTFDYQFSPVFGDKHLSLFDLRQTVR